MEVSRLWAPWRTPYIARARRGRQPCIFCAAARSREDRRVYVVFRGRRVYCLLNRYPYNNGHVMIAPYRHLRSLSQLAPGESSELMGVATRMIGVLRRILRPHGFNLGLNLGRAAGAGIAGHLHLHVVPRWVGDTNFMSVAGGTKVISQSLEALYDRLRRVAA